MLMWVGGYPNCFLLDAGATVSMLNHPYPERCPWAYEIPIKIETFTKKQRKRCLSKSLQCVLGHLECEHVFALHKLPYLSNLLGYVFLREIWIGP